MRTFNLSRILPAFPGPRKSTGPSRPRDAAAERCPAGLRAGQALRRGARGLGGSGGLRIGVGLVVDGSGIGLWLSKALVFQDPGKAGLWPKFHLELRSKSRRSCGSKPVLGSIILVGLGEFSPPILEAIFSGWIESDVHMGNEFWILTHGHMDAMRKTSGGE